MMGGFGMGGLGAIFWILVLGAILWTVAAAGAKSTRASLPESARAILDERLALGEVTVEEYRKLRAEL